MSKGRLGEGMEIGGFPWEQAIGGPQGSVEGFSLGFECRLGGIAWVKISRDFSGNYSRLPILKGGIKQCESMVILRDFSETTVHYLVGVGVIE